MADAISMAHLLQKLNVLEKEIQELKNNEKTQKQIADDQAVQQKALQQQLVQQQATINKQQVAIDKQNIAEHFWSDAVSQYAGFLADARNARR